SENESAGPIGPGREARSRTMRRLPLTLSLAAAAALASPSTAWAQRPGEVILFSQMGFRGQSFVISGQRDNLRVPWTVRSARVTRGDAWELCARTRFRSPCNRLATDVSNVAWRVASARL